MNSPDIQSAGQVTPTGPLPPQLLHYYASTDESAVHIVRILALAAIVAGGATMLIAGGEILLNIHSGFAPILGRAVSLSLSVGNFLVGIGLLAAGVGCLRLKAAARKLLIGCCWARLGLSSIFLIWSILRILLRMLQDPAYEGIGLLAVYAGNLAITTVIWGAPIILLTRESLNHAFGQGFEARPLPAARHDVYP